MSQGGPGRKTEVMPDEDGRAQGMSPFDISGSRSERRLDGAYCTGSWAKHNADVTPGSHAEVLESPCREEDPGG